MNERAQIVRENENVNTVEKFTSTSIIAAQKNGLSVYVIFFFSFYLPLWPWMVNSPLLPRNYWRRGVNFRGRGKISLDKIC